MGGHPDIRRYRHLRVGSRPWLSCFAVFGLACFAAAVCGCGTLSFKAGSTEGDYQAASDRCRKEGRAEGPDFEQCMRQQGWKVKQFGAPPTPQEATKQVPAESPSPGSQPSPAGGDVAPSPTLNEAPAAKGDAPSADNDTPSANSGAPSAERPVVVNNWFKLGGTADDFAAAKQRCATKLGAAAHAEPDSQPVTPEMIDCLRHEGWHAF